MLFNRLYTFMGFPSPISKPSFEGLPEDQLDWGQSRLEGMIFQGAGAIAEKALIPSLAK